MANRFWPNQNPLGRTIRLEGTNSEEITVVGVVSDVRHEIFDRVFRSIMYRPARQAPGLSMDFVLRSSGAPRELVAGTRLALRAIDPNVAVENAEAMTQKIEEQTSGLRYVASLMAVFGAVALVLSMIGIYGVIAHLVNERTQEIGIRIVLGAKPGNVLGLVMKSGLRLLVSGVVIGIAFSMALARVQPGVWSERLGFEGFRGSDHAIDGRRPGGELHSSTARLAGRSGRCAALRMIATFLPWTWKIRRRESLGSGQAGHGPCLPAAGWLCPYKFI